MDSLCIIVSNMYMFLFKRFLFYLKGPENTGISCISYLMYGEWFEMYSGLEIDRKFLSSTFKWGMGFYHQRSIKWAFNMHISPFGQCITTPYKTWRILVKKHGFFDVYIIFTARYQGYILDWNQNLWVERNAKRDIVNKRK